MPQPHPPASHTHQPHSGRNEDEKKHRRSEGDMTCLPWLRCTVDALLPVGAPNPYAQERVAPKPLFLPPGLGSLLLSLPACDDVLEDIHNSITVQGMLRRGSSAAYFHRGLLALYVPPFVAGRARSSPLGRPRLVCTVDYVPYHTMRISRATLGRTGFSGVAPCWRRAGSASPSVINKAGRTWLRLVVTPACTSVRPRPVHV